jgi:hypothetical protein
MAKLIGPIQYTGTIQDLSAYKMRGLDKIILRSKGGPTKQQIKNGRNFINVRRNNAEFAASTKAAASIRRALFAVKRLADPAATGRLNAICKAILKQDPRSERGKREVLFSQYGELLVGFNFNKNLLLNTVIRHPMFTSVDRSTGKASVEIPALIPGINFYCPPAFKLFRLTIALALVPDVLFRNGDYKYNSTTQVGKSVYSEWFSAKSQIQTQSFELEIDDPLVAENNFSMILAIGVEFGEAGNNNSIVPVRYGGCAGIVGVDA